MREEIVKEWFLAWFDPNWNRFQEIFVEHVYYSESWGPEYTGITEIEQWFRHWHTHTKLVAWDIKRFIHSDDELIVEWYFNCKDKEHISEFDGVSIIKFNENNKIMSVSEYGSSLPKYDPLNKENDARL